MKECLCCKYVTVNDCVVGKAHLFVLFNSFKNLAVREERGIINGYYENLKSGSSTFNCNQNQSDCTTRRMPPSHVCT